MILSSRLISSRFLKILLLIPLLLSSFYSSSLMALSARPASPLAEIKSIIAAKALHRPPTETLNQLSMKRLTTGLQSIDPFALYLPPGSSAKNSTVSLRVGLDVFAYKSRIWVSPEPGGPADRQALPDVGELRAVNNERITDNLEQASDLIDEAINEDLVVLDIYDAHNKHYKQHRIKPADYTASSVSVKRVGKYVFIRLSDFVSHQTAPSFSALYNTIGRSGSNFIIDLRRCPGGDLFEALEIAGMFVPAGLPLLTTYDQTGKLHTYTSPKGPKLSRPIGLLIDNRTASAAEILAGIFKEKTISPLVGQQSYGKCDSQTVFKLSNGGELWLTTLSMQFADGTSCTPKGVQPDIVYPDISIAGPADITNRLADW